MRVINCNEAGFVSGGSDFADKSNIELFFKSASIGAGLGVGALAAIPMAVVATVGLVCYYGIYTPIHYTASGVATAGSYTASTLYNSGAYVYNSVVG